MNEAKPQFSIRHLLVATAAVAAAVGAVAAKSDLVTVVTLDLMAVFLCSFTILAALMTAGKLRAFWIGAAVPAMAGVAIAVLAYHIFRVDVRFDRSSGDELGKYLKDYATELRGGLPPVWCVGVVNGLLCVFVHWLIRPKLPKP